MSVDSGRLTEPFVPATTSYTAVFVEGHVTSATVTATATDDTNATIMINGVAVGSGVESDSIDLIDMSGENTIITVAVTAQDRTMATYVITVAFEQDTLPSFGDRVIPAQVFVFDMDVDVTLTEAVRGNVPLAYSLSPALPPMLEYTANNRSITGAPSQTFTPTLYTYTVTDTNGDTTSAVFTVTVYNPVMLEAIPDVGLTAGRPITPFTLPAASGGSGEYDYEGTGPACEP